ncbi:hypothetical protein ABIB95_007758 [Bradyrhizobium sp. LA2.1]
MQILSLNFHSLAEADSIDRPISRASSYTPDHPQLS